MNLLAGIHHKARPIALFMVVMLVVLGSSFLERHLLHRVGTSALGLYQDRLLPATGLFELNELLHARQQLLAAHLAADPASRSTATPGQLANYREQLRTLVGQHQQTYLVAEEKQALSAFQTRLARFDALEAQLLATPAPPTAAQLAKVARQFGQLHAGLSRLNQIQQRVGQQLLENARVTESNAELLSNCKIALLLFFTLAIQHALLTARHPLIPKKLQNFRLN